VTKQGAFLLSRHGKCFVYFSTQNSRLQQEVPRQRIEIPPEYKEAIQSIIDVYPSYLKVASMVKKFEEGNKRKAFCKLLKQLAEYQILAVQ